ncbi:hypothetical protein HBZC1_16530 [Helicobacter bizzozeronii CIII-1]|uniref:Uncharacterized protein n=1 Tax=Helicobacter bizzozeronii (strain CIII-1) TaxID=1002804 RepID=F8KPC1_HELBC|nr:hypothetical protein HBZC1_16530 [Helicobacter bizzozeronii CIII-1]
MGKNSGLVWGKCVAFSKKCVFKVYKKMPCYILKQTYF